MIKQIKVRASWTVIQAAPSESLEKKTLRSRNIVVKPAAAQWSFGESLGIHYLSEYLWSKIVKTGITVANDFWICVVICHVFIFSEKIIHNLVCDLAGHILADSLTNLWTRAVRRIAIMEDYMISETQRIISDLKLSGCYQHARIWTRHDKT